MPYRLNTAIDLPTAVPNVLPALRQILQAINAAVNLDATLDLLVKKTTEVMRVDSSAVYLLDSDGQTLRLRATTGLSPEAVGQATLRLGEGMTGQAVLYNRAVYSSNAQQHPAFKLVPGTGEGAYRALLAVPLVLVPGTAIGALNVQTLQAREFSQDEVELLLLIADLASGALNKAELLDRQRRQLADLQALGEISQVVTTPQFLDEILQVVAEMALKLLKVSVCSIFLLEEHHQRLVLHAAAHLPHVKYSHRPPLKLGLGIIGTVAASGQAAWVLDVRYNPLYLRPHLAREEGLVSLLSVPLSVRGNVIGVLNCYTSEFHSFNDQERALIETLANQTALAIENSRLATNAAMVREMHHRIKNNLQNIVMLMEMQLLDAQQLNAREVLETNIHRIQSIAVVHEVLSQRGFQQVDVRDVLERVVQVTSDGLMNPSRQIQVLVQGMTFHLPSREATSLTLVVNELLQNALEHAFTGLPHGQVQIILEKNGGQCRVRVRDNGNGLPPGSDPTRLPGLGLQIANTLVKEELHGKLHFLAQQSGLEVVVELTIVE